MARKRKQPASAAGTPKQPQRKRQEQSEPLPQEQEQEAEEQTPTTPTVEHYQQQPEEDNPASPQQAEDAEEVEEEEQEDEEAEEEEEEAEEEEEEVEEEEEEEEVEQEETEIDMGNQIANGFDPPPKSQSDSQPLATEKQDDRDGASGASGGGDDEPIHKLLDPFSKEQIFNLLLEAAEKHADVADRIRRVADEDPVHRKIFVHGLGWDTTAETLVNVFGQYGPIEDCKAVSDKISGKSKGYGFILFKSRKGARKALEQPQKKIGNRMTACQLASMGPVPASAGAAAAATTQLPSALALPPVSEYTLRKIYVSNVSAELDPQKLLAFFAKFGEIEEGPLGLDKYTGKPKGFCLFVYRSSESAKKALEEPHKNFEGHILHCQKAIDGPKPGKSHSLHHHHSNPQSASFQRGKNLNFTGPAAAGAPTHLMAPSAPGIGLSQQAQTLNPAAVGQALSALLASQGAAGLGFTNLLSSLGSASSSQGVPGYGTQGVQGGFGNQGVGTSVSPGVMGGYGNQSGYPNQQMGQGGSGRPQHSQHGVGHMGGAPPYMNH